MYRIFIHTCLWFLAAVSVWGIASKVGGYVTAEADRLLKAGAASVFRSADIRWESTRIRMSQLSLLLRDARVSIPHGPGFRIDRVAISVVPRFPLAIDHIKVDMSNIRLLRYEGSFEDENNGFFPIDPAGMAADLALVAAYQPSIHRFEIKYLRLEDFNWGQLNLHLVANHVFPRKIMDGQFDSLQLQTVELKYEDYNLLEWATSVFLEKDDTFRQFALESVDICSDRARMQNHPDRAESLAELKAFIQDPGKFGFELTLRHPVTIPQIINARRVSTLLDMIDLRVPNA